MENMLFCENLTEAMRLEEAAKTRAAELLREMPYYVQTPGTLGIKVYSVKHSFSGWSIAAELTYDGETLRKYDSFELLELDLLHLQMAALRRTSL